MPEITKPKVEALQLPVWFWAVFFPLTVFVYLFGLTLPFVGPDEPRYAEVAREMFQRGDWVTPTLGGFNWFEKPALLYWFEIISYYTFGVNEFAARLGPAVCGLGTIFSLWVIGRKLFAQTQFSNWTALITASTLSLIVFSRGASFDIVVTFPITASLAAFIIYDLDERRSFLPLLWFYFFAGVALLAKGLIGLIFPFAIVVIYQLISRSWPDRRSWISLAWGLPLILVVAGSWYLPMYLRHGYQFVDEFIIQQHFQRFTSNKYQHPQPFIFFFWVLPLMTLPWLPFFLIGLLRTFKEFIPGSRKVAQETTDQPVSAHSIESRLQLFSLVWVLIPLIFFSFSGSKLPGYILPAIPGALLLSSFPVIKFINSSPFRAKLVVAMASITYALVIVALIFFIPGFMRSETVKGLLAAANSKGYQNLPVSGFNTVVHNAEFYAAGRLVRDQDGKQHRFIGAAELREFIDSHNGTPILVFCPLEHIRHLTNNELLDTQVIDDNGELDIALVRRK